MEGYNRARQDFDGTSFQICGTELKPGEEKVARKALCGTRKHEVKARF